MGRLRKPLVEKVEDTLNGMFPMIPPQVNGATSEVKTLRRQWVEVSNDSAPS